MESDFLLGLIKDGVISGALIYVVRLYIDDSRSTRREHRELIEKLLGNHMAHCNSALERLANAVDNLVSKIDK